MTTRAKVPLKFLATINERALPETTPADFQFRYLDISAVGRGELTDEPEAMTFGAAPSRARRLVRPGDTIISTVRTYLRAVWPVEGPTADLVVSTGFAVLTPGPDLDPDFLGWLAQSDPVVENVVARSVGVSYPAINASDLGDIRVPLPSLPEQRAIARHLGAETRKIDAVLAARKEHLARLDERDFAVLSSDLIPPGTRMRRLGYTATVQTGLTVDAQRDAGADAVTRPYLRVANVQPGWLELDSVTEVTVPAALAMRCLLRPGDVLMTEGGDLDKLGRGTVWRDELPGALHQNHVFAVRPDKDELSSDYLSLLTRTAHARSYFERTGTRTTNLASTNSEKILGLPVPDLSRDEQERLVMSVTRKLAAVAELRALLLRQASLLAERRQALITAAVTGELEIIRVAA